jgi:hypothetical protein
MESERATNQKAQTSANNTHARASGTEAISYTKNCRLVMVNEKSMIWSNYVPVGQLSDERTSEYGMELKLCNRPLLKEQKQLNCTESIAVPSVVVSSRNKSPSSTSADPHHELEYQIKPSHV